MRKELEDPKEKELLGRQNFQGQYAAFNYIPLIQPFFPRSHPSTVDGIEPITSIVFTKGSIILSILNNRCREIKMKLVRIKVWLLGREPEEEVVQKKLYNS